MNEHMNAFLSSLIPVVVLVIFFSVMAFGIRYILIENEKTENYYNCTLIKNKSPEYCLEIINGVDKIK